MIYTVFGVDFAKWVEARILERNQKMEVKQNLLINMDPNVAAAFEASKQVSCKLILSLKVHVYSQQWKRLSPAEGRLKKAKDSG